jgi:hypothetical protein
VTVDEGISVGKGVSPGIEVRQAGNKRAKKINARELIAVLLPLLYFIP